MTRTVVGLFDTRSDAESTIAVLVENQVPRETISLIVRDLAAATVPEEQGSRKSVAQGALSGSMIGGIIGLLAGISIGAIPGIGPVLAAGPLFTAIGAAAAGAGVGAVTGGLLGLLVDAGIPEAHAHFYAESVRRGSILVSVTASDHIAGIAARILGDRGVAIGARMEEWQRNGWTYVDADSTLMAQPGVPIEAMPPRDVEPPRGPAPEIHGRDASIDARSIGGAVIDSDAPAEGDSAMEHHDPYLEADEIGNIELKKRRGDPAP